MLIPKNILGITRRSLQNTSTRRKLYYAEHIPGPSVPPFPIPPTSTLRRGTPIRQQPVEMEKDDAQDQVNGMLDKLINGMKSFEDVGVENDRVEQTRTKQLNFNLLPLKLLEKLNKTSDYHVKLGCLLDYRYLLKVKPEFVENTLFKLGIETAEDICDLLSEDLVLKWVKFQLTHKDFTKAGQVINQIIMRRNGDLDVEKLCATVFNTLRSDHDLKYGVLDLMRALYELLDHQNTLFKFVYTTLTNNEEIMVSNGVEYKFEDIWKMIQLCRVIEEVADVRVLPEPYWKTDFDYINLILGLKCFKAGDLERGFSHLKRRKVIGNDGVVYRVIKAGLENKTKNTTSTESMVKPTNFENKVLKVIISNNERHLSPIDLLTFQKFSKNIYTFNNSVKELTNKETVFALKNVCLKNFLNSGLLKLAQNMVANNLDQVYKFEVSYLATVFHLTNDSQLLGEVVSRLPTVTKSSFLSVLFTQQLKIEQSNYHTKESKIPEKQFEKIQWILEAVNYQLSDKNFRKITPLLTKLPLKLQQSIITKISGPNFPLYIKYLSSGIPLSSTLIPILVNTGKCRTRSELQSLARYISRSCSVEEIGYILSNIKEQIRYDSLHLKITDALIRFGVPDFDKAKQLIEEHPHDRSKFLLNQVLLQKNETIINYSDSYVKKPIELVKLKALYRLTDDTKLGYGSSLRAQVGRLIMANKFDKNMAVLLLKKMVSKIKSNGELKNTERLKYGVAICQRYGVSEEVISEILHA